MTLLSSQTFVDKSNDNISQWTTQSKWMCHRTNASTRFCTFKIPNQMQTTSSNGHTHTHTLLPTTITDNINWKLKLSAPTTQTSRLKFNRTTWNMNPSSICSRWFTIHYCCHLRGFFTFPFSLCHCRMGCPQWKVTWNFFFIHLDFMVSDTYYEFHIVAFHSVFKFSVYISCNRKRIEPSNLNTDSMATCP